MAELKETNSEEDKTLQIVEDEADLETNKENVVADESTQAEIVPMAVEPDSPQPSDLNNAKKSRFTSIKALLKNKKFFIPAGIVLVLLILVISLTNFKYSLLGVFVKRDVSVEVVDDKTLQPISGVSVEMAGRKGLTDGEGQVKIDNVKVGKNKVKISKSGYESKTQDTLVRFSTTKLEPIRLVGSGYKLSFIVKDRVSGAPIKDAKIVLGGVESFTNNKGEADARVSPSGSAKLSLSTSKEGFNTVTQDVEVVDNSPLREIILTPSGTVLFVSNKSKKYDVYASDLDGKNERVVLKASGKENENTALYPSPTGEYVALVASRDGRVGEYGGLEQELYVINVASGELKKIEERPGQVNWSGNTLISDTSTPPAYDSKVIAYNAETKSKKDLFTLNGSYLLAEGKIYFSLGDVNKPDFGFFVMNIDGSAKKKLDAKPFDIYRQNIGSLTLVDFDRGTFSINFGSDKIVKTSDDASALKTLQVISSKDNSTRVFTRVIDSFSQLFKASPDGSNEKQLTKGANVSDSFYTTPNGTNVIFYGSVGTEAGVYIVSVNGGSPLKIANGHIVPRAGPGGR